ncbi:TIR-like protein FxsC [Dactylosporangium sp. AC04546]|uniref:TIR-like protein FxsC n=1 Tax=Dactylosporangium sp. AC04546 TaxID=2862460 RepID=UPI001EDE8777|nr:TIR-like protein FxsC [Dactylosporangium sp. AC04546]WVK84141.1 TIR-like protein FxsC [Dactylosporangium sp. AC04546]
MVEEQPPQAPDRRAPVFFLSYAQSGARNDWVPQFFDELSDHVGELMGIPPPLVGFINTDMRTGTDWNEELAFAVGHCRVFVALLSPLYFTSPWCALEWHAFASRLPGGGSKTMLPVLWTVGNGPIPRKIDRLQRFLPTPPPDGIQRRYGKEGVYGLRAAESSDYGMVVWRLANAIADAAEKDHVPPSDATGFEGLPESFEEDPS